MLLAQIIDGLAVTTSQDCGELPTKVAEVEKSFSLIERGEFEFEHPITNVNTEIESIVFRKSLLNM
jgi:hypothetical protein